MKSLLIFGALAACALAGTPQFTVCSDSKAALTDVTVSSPEGDWAGGTKVSVVVTGKLTKQISSGATISTVAYFGGSEVSNKQDELCSYEGTPFHCPEQEGDHSWIFPFDIPAVPFPATLTSHSDFKNSDGSSILCFEVTVDL